MLCKWLANNLVSMYMETNSFKSCTFVWVSFVNLRFYTSPSNLKHNFKTCGFDAIGVSAMFINFFMKKNMEKMGYGWGVLIESVWFGFVPTDRMQKVPFSKWMANGWEEDRSEQTGPQGSHQLPNQTMKVNQFKQHLTASFVL